MQHSSLEVLQVIARVQTLSFPQLLQQLLTACNGKKSDLYEFLYSNGYLLEKTSMYRYFNTSQKVSRIPDEEFVQLFADYIGLDDHERDALLFLRHLKRYKR